MRGRDAQAEALVHRVQPGVDAAAEVRAIRSAIETDAAVAKGSTLRGPVLGLKKIVWLGIILSVFQQFVGINVIFYYSTELWAAVGFTLSDSLTISVVTGILNILVTLIAIALVDRIGRRPILMTGSIGMAVSLAVMAIAFTQQVDGRIEGAWGPIALVAANLFVVCFGASWGPLVWVLLGEIFPNSIRAKALGVAAAAQWIANFTVTVTFPALSGASLSLTYGAYALFAALSFVFVLRFIPETKGMKLEDADTLLDRKPAAPVATS
jgi:SP family sugar:H+ symporter-like MFS transporter